MCLSAFMALLMTTTAAVPSGHPLCVQRFDEDFQQLPASCIDTGGEVITAHALPNGGMAALVKNAETPGFQLVRWNGDASAAPERHRLDVGGRLLSSRARAEGDLIVVTERAIVRVGPDGMIAARRSLALPVGTIAAAAPDGVWLLSADRLMWTGLDGSERSLTGPWPAPRWRPGSQTPPARPQSAALFSTTSNDAVLVEKIIEEHPVVEHQPNDVTSTLAVTRVDRDGRTLGDTSIGKVRTRWEWFWTESSSSNPTPFPSHLGLVRTRWEGTVQLWAVAEQAEGRIVLVLEFDQNHRLMLLGLDERLEQAWSRRIGAESVHFASPPWAHGLLFFHRFGSVFACDDRGRSGRSNGIPFPKPFGDAAPRGASVGQTPTGEWYIVLW